jgi:hypothetical protein
MLKYISWENNKNQYIINSNDIDERYIDELTISGFINQEIPFNKLMIIIRLLGANIINLIEEKDIIKFDYFKLGIKSETYEYLIKMIYKKQIFEWIMNSNKVIKREFLSGFIGKNGDKIMIRNDNNKIKITGGRICQISNYKNLNDIKNIMTIVCKILKEFNIESNIQIDKNNKLDDNCIFLNIDLDIKNMLNVINNIEFSYNNEK